MGVAFTLDEMSLYEKLQTMEILWDDLCHHVNDVASPEWHHEVLASREADLHEGKGQFTDWDSAKKDIRESLQ